MPSKGKGPIEWGGVMVVEFVSIVQPIRFSCELQSFVVTIVDANSLDTQSHATMGMI